MFNDRPVLNPIGNKNIDEGAQLTFTAAATDVFPGTGLAYSLVSAPPGAAINPTSGVFTWTPTEAQGPGTYPFDVSVSDGTLTDSETIIVTVAEVNLAPVLGAIGNRSVNEGSQLAFTASATDNDLPANTLTFSVAGAPTGAAINPTSGAFTWTPTEAQGFGTYPFDVCVSDGTTTDCETITVTVGEVNVAPVLAAIGDQSVNEGSLLEFTASAMDDDLPANTLTFSLVGAPTGAVIDPTSGAFTWTPTEAQGPGIYPFDVSVSDGTLIDSETITVTVTNLAPVLGAIGDQAVNEGSLLAFTATAIDIDLPANTLAFSLVGAPTGAAIDPTSGAFTWAPTEAQGPGTYPFDVCVSDGTATDCETITVTVGEVNVGPVLAAIGDQSVNEEAQLAFTASATDNDLPTNILTFSLVGAPAGAVINPISGAFTWTPTEAQGPGTYPFDVCVSDGTIADCETITVTVANINIAPVLAAIGDQSVNEGSLLAFTTSATDVDLPANTLTFSLVGAPTGAAINPTSGAFAWTPTEAQGPGPYPFDVCVSDGTITDCETITVAVGEVNVAPVLDAIGNKSVDEEKPLAFTASATDSDLPANTLTFSLEGAPAGAAINPTSGAFTWTPDKFQGPAKYTFTVRVCDNGTPQICDEEVITVTVNGIYTIYMPMLFKSPAPLQGSDLVPPVIDNSKK